MDFTGDQKEREDSKGAPARKKSERSRSFKKEPVRRSFVSKWLGLVPLFLVSLPWAGQGQKGGRDCLQLRNWKSWGKGQWEEHLLGMLPWRSYGLP